MSSIKRGTHTFYSKIYGSFNREKQFSDYKLMKSRFFFQIHAMFWEKWYILWLLFFISERFYNFFLTWGYHW